jgi:hypothetical protein
MGISSSGALEQLLHSLLTTVSQLLQLEGAR